ncbi:MAG: hypothetical protein MK052_08815 [Alphaproteobacteria bacterium]|nr:hypothetical protein [Alphaproteobacteria bacterium]
MPFNRFLFFSVALAASIGNGQAVAQVNQQYAACTHSIATNPEAAYKKARAWYGTSKTLAAQHCMALALYEMKDFNGASNALETILRGMTPSQGQLWLSMKLQTSKAHYAAGNFGAAKKHLDDSIYWATDRAVDEEIVPFLLQRAKVFIKQAQHLKAVQDYDHAISIAPSVQSHLLRAKLLISMGKHAQAQEDIDAILESDPGNIAAKNLLKNIR